MIDLLDRLTSRMDKGGRVEVYCPDLEKTLDTVNNGHIDQKPKTFEVDVRVIN